MSFRMSLTKLFEVTADSAGMSSSLIHDVLRLEWFLKNNELLSMTFVKGDEIHRALVVILRPACELISSLESLGCDESSIRNIWISTAAALDVLWQDELEAAGYLPDDEEEQEDIRLEGMGLGYSPGEGT